MIVKNLVFKPQPAIINKILVDMHVRYWEDCEIDGREFEEDESDEEEIKDLLTRWDPEYKIGLVDGEVIRLIINPETGKVENYLGKREIKMYFKVCDECTWVMTERKSNGINPTDAYDVTILGEENDYVPDFLSIDDEGYGDYVNITIGKDGIIKDWDPKWLARWIEDASRRINGECDD